LCAEGEDGGDDEEADGEEDVYTDALEKLWLMMLVNALTRRVEGKCLLERKMPFSSMSSEGL